MTPEEAQSAADAYIESCREPEVDDVDLFPMQPIGYDSHGIPRFRENRIVDWLLKKCQADGFGLNTIARMHAQGEFDDAEMIQLSQLIGYSVSGYGDLSYVQRHATKACDPADEAADALPPYKVVERLGTLAGDDDGAE